MIRLARFLAGDLVVGRPRGRAAAQMRQLIAENWLAEQA